MVKRYTAVSEVLAAALRKFGPEGQYWIKGAEHRCSKNGEDKYCMLGAVKAVTNSKEQLDLRSKALVVLAKHVGNCWIPGFNDTPGRRFPEIKLAMCSAIKGALAQEKKGKNAGTRVSK